MRGRIGIGRYGPCVLAAMAWPAIALALPSSPTETFSNEAVDTPQLPTAPEVLPGARVVQVQAKPVPSDNPLWGIPVKQLSNTRERPIFSMSRRPPPPVAVGPAPVAVAPPPPKPREPEQPKLVLLGTIVNSKDSYAIFMDQVTKTPVRVKIDESYQDWKLRSIKGGTVTLAKGQDSAILVFPNPAGGKPSMLSRIFSVGMQGKGQPPPPSLPPGSTFPSVQPGTLISTPPPNRQEPPK